MDFRAWTLVTGFCPSANDPAVLRFSTYHILLLFMAEWYGLVWVCHTWCIHSSFDVLFGVCLCYEWCSSNMPCKFSHWCTFLFPLDPCLGHIISWHYVYLMEDLMNSFSKWPYAGVLMVSYCPYEVIQCLSPSPIHLLILNSNHSPGFAHLA